MRVATILFFIIGVFSATLFSQEKIVHGFVFFDTNHNQIFDAGEKGIPEVLISNQETIVKTNDAGFFQMPVKEGAFIYLVKPSGYELAKDTNNLPGFYYYNPFNLKPNYLHYPLANKELPENLNFALYPTIEKDSFQALFLGDPQMHFSKQVGYFRDEIIPDIISYENSSDFYMVLGDIADDNLMIYPEFRDVLKPLKKPGFFVFGNHDINVDALNNIQEAETFRHFMGPDFYSFNEGKVHFVALNTVDYQGWDTATHKSRNYFGGLPFNQLHWLKNDLEHVPDSFLIVLTGHIPLHKNFFDSVTLVKLFEILENRKHILSLSGHLHATQRYFMNENPMWKGTGNFEYINVGATCGSWWTGPKDERGIPAATCMDGTPNGFFVFQFNGNRYSFDFHEAGKGIGNEFRISNPDGILDFDSLKHQSIIINVFAGNSQTKVLCQIDSLPIQSCIRYKGTDPFIERTRFLRVNDDNWTPGVLASSHLWKSAFPPAITKGTHRLRVEVYRDGKAFILEKIFQIK